MNEFKDLDYDELDKVLNEKIGSELKELEGLKIENKEIRNPKKLTESISQIVWEQFVLQIAGQAGEDFIKQNNDFNLSLKKADHFLNSEDFGEGKIPTHNFENSEKYKERYDSYSKNIARDENGNVVMHQTRTGKEEATLVKGAREKFDKGRPTGSKENHTAMDHTISAAEIMRDKEAGAYLSEEQKINFANSKDNLNEMNSSWNDSKSDMSTSDWLGNPNSKGQKPRDIFDMSDQDETKLRQKDSEAREKWDELKEQGKEKAQEEGKASIKREAVASAKITTQAIAVALFAKLTRTVFEELIRWLGEKDKKTKTLIEHLKKAIHDFVFDFKNNVLLSIDVGATVILTQLFGEIIPMIRKALLFIKIGGEGIYKVAKYLKDPENAEKDTSTKVMEIGKIVTISLTTAGSIGLGMAITAVLEHYAPPLAVQIPLLGSPASLLGIFFGGLTAGICGAIVLNRIEGCLQGKLISENISKQLVVQSGILELQDKQFQLYENEVESASNKTAKNISSNIKEAVDEMQRKRDSINEERKTENEDKLNNIASLLDDIDF